MADILRRTTLMVRDAEVAAAWYEQVFGMTRFMDTPFTLSGRMLAAGAAGDRTRLVILRCEHDHIGMIGLLQWLNPQMPAPAELPTCIAFGAPVFVVQALDCAATVARARTLGSRIHAEAESWSTTGADGQGIDMIGGSFWDLDGYFFEVNQRVGVAA